MSFIIVLYALLRYTHTGSQSYVNVHSILRTSQVIKLKTVVIANTTQPMKCPKYLLLTTKHNSIAWVVKRLKSDLPRLQRQIPVTSTNRSTTRSKQINSLGDYSGSPIYL